MYDVKIGEEIKNGIRKKNSQISTTIDKYSASAFFYIQ